MLQMRGKATAGCVARLGQLFDWKNEHDEDEALKYLTVLT
jgi:hypothetical protein